MTKRQVPVLMTAKRYKAGFTLLELMIAAAVGSFLLLLIVGFFSRASVFNRELLLRLQLQQEVQKVLQLMAKDISRSGFAYLDQRIEQTNLALFNHADGSSTTITAANRESANSCLLFWYDLDHSGCVGGNHGRQCQVAGQNRTLDIQKELLGYRLKSKMVETRAMYKSGTIQQCEREQCHAYLAKNGCDTRGWADLLDSDIYQVSRLHFSWLAQRRGVLVQIQANYKREPHIQYQSAVVIALHNRLLAGE
ncbi:prepilin-type N-terminal cleavage/methylation domain-containing protein [Testudinibacter sp. P80/BLE/0925]|uniref:prepilin-type N-terminal cleavage/methylation domain-containing protein n=1 Tax=Testudinibacter sp. TW-1 TaxID=3417757 RepID=UPI003D364AB6